MNLIFIFANIFTNEGMHNQRTDTWIYEWVTPRSGQQVFQDILQVSEAYHSNRKTSMLSWRRPVMKHVINSFIVEWRNLLMPPSGSGKLCDW